MARSASPPNSIASENSACIIKDEVDVSFEGNDENTLQEETAERAYFVDRKIYSCQICGKYYTQKSSLNRHFTIHSGHKPYCCTVCGKSFTRKDTCADHIRLHYAKINRFDKN